MDQPPPLSPYTNLSLVILSLRKAVGDWGVHGVWTMALLLLVQHRLGRACGQMERMAVRFQAGRLWRRAARTVGAMVGGGDRCKPVRRWPYGFGWLVEMHKHRAAGFGSQLQFALAQPEMVALLAASPQAQRILRPICRMLGLENSAWRPRVAAVSVAAEDGEAAGIVAAVKQRVRKRLAAKDLWRIPLPRGVLSAARRQGYGKLC